MLPANGTLAVQKMRLAFSLLLQSYIALCTSVPWCFPGEDLMHVLQNLVSTVCSWNCSTPSSLQDDGALSLGHAFPAGQLMAKVPKLS